MIKKCFIIWLCFVLFICAFNDVFKLDLNYYDSVHFFANVINKVGDIADSSVSMVLDIKSIVFPSTNKELSKKIDSERSYFINLTHRSLYWSEFRQLVLYCECGGLCFEEAKNFVINAFYGDAKAYLKSESNRKKNIFERSCLGVGLIGSIRDHSDKALSIYNEGIEAGYSCDNTYYFSSDKGFQLDFICPYVNEVK